VEKNREKGEKKHSLTGKCEKKGGKTGGGRGALRKIDGKNGVLRRSQGNFANIFRGTSIDSGKDGE